MEVRTLSLSLTLGAIAVTTAPGADWTQWRGPQRDGQVATETPWPDRIGEAELVKEWHRPLDKGYSAPIVSGELVFTVETRGEKEEVVRAFDRKSGEQRWETAWEGAMKVPFFARKNGSWVRCTPATDGTHLFVGGMRDVLVCLENATGRIVWKVDFVEREGSPLPSFGFVSSPLLDGDRLYVQAGAEVSRIDKATGAKVWGALQDKRAMYGSAFSSPVLAELGGRRQLVAQTRTSLVGIDPESGAPLWDYRVKAFRNMNILTPTVANDRLFTATYGGGSFGLQWRQGDGQPGLTQAWGAEKIEGYMSSPVLIDGKIYLHGRDKRAHCFDLASGEKHWSSDESFGEYWSMVARGNRILALDEGGELLLIDASPDGFKVRDRREVADAPTWAHLAVCGPELYIRDLNGIARWTWGAATEVSAAGR